jgi:hypothetical protein
MAQGILPARPLRLRASFVLRTWIAVFMVAGLGLVLLVGVPIWQAGDARAILADEAIWSAGIPAVRAKAEATETSRQLVFNEYDVRVTYLDAKGDEHTGRAQFDTLLSSVGDDSPTTVRYDPRAPDRFVISWAHDLRGSRWASFATLMLAGIGIGGFLLYSCTRVLRRLHAARLAATASEEVELPLTHLEEASQYGRATGLVRYYYRVTTPSGEKQREVVFNRRKGHEPLFADAARTRVLSLRAAGALDEPVVLRNDFFPFEVSDQDRRAVAAALEARGA